jgi:exosortase
VGSAFVLLYGVVPYTHSHLMHLTSVFGALWVMWTRFPDFQHGMLVPVLSAFIIYTRRRQLATLPITGWWPGVLAFAFALVVFWAGRRVDNQYIGFFSIQLYFASAVLWLLGWAWLRALTFPLAFLVFAWPMPFLDGLITFPLRLLMSNASVLTLQVLGVDAVQQGTAIVSAARPEMGMAAGGAFAVDVADPCSGIRSLFALMMISALYGCFVLKTPWQRGLLFLASVPLAVAGNLARILCLTLGTIVLGPKVAIGTLENPTIFHLLAGYVVFVIALGGMFGVASLLQLKSGEIHAFVRRVRGFAQNAPEIGAIKPRRERDSLSPDLY